MTESTEPLKNGAKLPTHPATTTARKIIKYGEVRDAHNGNLLSLGKLHEQDIRSLMIGNTNLSHLYLYAIRNGHIIHTRPGVVISVETVEAEDGPEDQPT